MAASTLPRIKSAKDLVRWFENVPEKRIGHMPAPYSEAADLLSSGYPAEYLRKERLTEEALPAPVDLGTEDYTDIPELNAEPREYTLADFLKDC